MKNTPMTIYLAAFLFMPIIAYAQSPTEQSLIGTWQCDAILHASLFESDQSRFTVGWAPDSDGLTVALKDTRLVFQNSGGSFTVTTSTPNPFVISSDEAVKSTFRVIAGQLVFRYEGSGVNYFYEIRHVDKESLELVPQSGTTFPTLTCRHLDAVSTHGADAFAFGRMTVASTGNGYSVYTTGGDFIIIDNGNDEAKKMFLDGDGFIDSGSSTFIPQVADNKIKF